MKYRVICLSDGSAWKDTPANQHEVACRILAGASVCVHEAKPPSWCSPTNEAAALRAAWGKHIDHLSLSERNEIPPGKWPFMDRKFGDGPPVQDTKRYSQVLRELEARAIPADEQEPFRLK